MMTVIIFYYSLSCCDLLVAGGLWLFWLLMSYVIFCISACENSVSSVSKRMHVLCVTLHLTPKNKLGEVLHWPKTAIKKWSRTAKSLCKIILRRRWICRTRKWQTKKYNNWNTQDLKLTDQIAGLKMQHPEIEPINFTIQHKTRGVNILSAHF